MRQPCLTIRPNYKLLPATQTTPSHSLIPTLMLLGSIHNLNYRRSSQFSPNILCNPNSRPSTHTNSKLNKKRCRLNICGNNKNGYVNNKRYRLSNNRRFYNNSSSRSGYGSNKHCKPNIKPSNRYLPSLRDSAQTIRSHPQYLQPQRLARQLTAAMDPFSIYRAHLPTLLHHHTLRRPLRHRHFHLLRPERRMVQVPANRPGVQRVPTRSTLISQTSLLIVTMDKTPSETLVCFGTVRHRLAGLLSKRPGLGPIIHLRKDTNNQMTNRSSPYDTSFPPIAIGLCSWTTTVLKRQWPLAVWSLGPLRFSSLSPCPLVLTYIMYMPLP